MVTYKFLKCWSETFSINFDRCFYQVRENFFSEFPEGIFLLNEFSGVSEVMPFWDRLFHIRYIHRASLLSEFFDV